MYLASSPDLGAPCALPCLSVRRIYLMVYFLFCFAPQSWRRKVSSLDFYPVVIVEETRERPKRVRSRKGSREQPGIQGSVIDRVCRSSEVDGARVQIPTHRGRYPPVGAPPFLPALLSARIGAIRGRRAPSPPVTAALPLGARDRRYRLWYFAITAESTKAEG